MKKSLIYIFTLLAMGLTIVSCTDEDLFKNEVFFELERGGFVRFTDVNTVFEMGGDTPQAASFSGEIWDPNNNLQALEMYLLTSSDTFLLDTHTTFPFTFSISGTDIEDITGETVAFGQSFNFESVAVRNDGTRFTVAPLGAGSDSSYVGNTQPNLLDLGNGYKSALQFSLIIACPSIDPVFATGLSGTWNFDRDAAFGQTGETFTVNAGPEDNQITLIEPFEAGFNVVVTFNEDGTATVPKQDAWVSGNFGQASVEGSGQYFGCANLVILNLEHTVSAGSFGTFNLTISRP